MRIAVVVSVATPRGQRSYAFHSGFCLECVVLLQHCICSLTAPDDITLTKGLVIVCYCRK
jgi:hypothetical protein